MTEGREARDSHAEEASTEPELVLEEDLTPEEGAPERAEVDWERIAAEHLDALQRARAEFDNFRKRTMREQTDLIARATQGLVGRLLSVLDNFDRAIAHGDTSPGLALVHRELTDVLRSEGLALIDAEGKPFDPHLHEAVESHEDANVDEPTVSEVHQNGYLFKGKVLRPALVAVARPAENEADSPDGGE